MSKTKKLGENENLISIEQRKVLEQNVQHLGELLNKDNREIKIQEIIIKYKSIQFLAKLFYIEIFSMLLIASFTFYDTRFTTQFYHFFNSLGFLLFVIMLGGIFILILFSLIILPYLIRKFKTVNGGYIIIAKGEKLTSQERKEIEINLRTIFRTLGFEWKSKNSNEINLLNSRVLGKKFDVEVFTGERIIEIKMISTLSIIKYLQKILTPSFNSYFTVTSTTQIMEIAANANITTTNSPTIKADNLAELQWIFDEKKGKITTNSDKYSFFKVNRSYVTWLILLIYVIGVYTLLFSEYGAQRNYLIIIPSILPFVAFYYLKDFGYKKIEVLHKYQNDIHFENLFLQIAIRKQLSEIVGNNYQKRSYKFQNKIIVWPTFADPMSKIIVSRKKEYPQFFKLQIKVKRNNYDRTYQIIENKIKEIRSIPSKKKIMELSPRYSNVEDWQISNYTNTEKINRGRIKLSEYSKREIIRPWIVMIIIMFVILSPLYFSPYNKIPSNANLVANYQLNSNFKYFSYEVKKTDRYLLDYHFYNSSNQNLYFNFSILIDNKIAISYNSSDYSQKLITKIRNWSDQDEYFLQKGQIITIEGTTVGKDEIRLYNNIRYDLANYGFNVPIIIFLVYLIPIYLFFTDKIYRYRDIGDIPQIFKDCLNNEKVYPDISSSLKLFLFNLFSLLVLVVQILLSLQYKNSISDFYRLSIFDFGGYAFGIYIASILINLFSVLLMMYYNYLTKRKRMILFLFWFIIYSLAFTFLVPGIIDFFRNSSFGWAW